MTDVRAKAAGVLAEVALGGASLREAAGRALPQLSDSRDRALLTALTSEGARWWLRFDAALARLLDRPLPKRESAVHALLVLGLVQIEVLRLPEYAAVAATVDAMRALGRPRYAGLANALLRRWLRERAELSRQLDGDAITRHAIPAWMLQALRDDWPDQIEAILAASNASAPPMLRANRRHGTRDALLARFAAAGVEAEASSWLPDAVVLAAPTDVTRLPGFEDGAFSVQDGAAQLAADLLNARDGMRVLDACAAPGGKAAHLLERNDLDLMALDSSATRLQRVQQNFTRLGLTAEIRAGDATTATWWDGRPFQRILLDAPCSATGVIRRHPDIKLHRRAQDIAVLARQQGCLLARLWPMLAPGGRLLYATCSLLRAENERVVGAFLDAHADARDATPAQQNGQAAGAGWQLLPGIDGVDGMFYAVLDKAG